MLKNYKKINCCWNWGSHWHLWPWLAERRRLELSTSDEGESNSQVSHDEGQQITVINEGYTDDDTDSHYGGGEDRFYTNDDDLIEFEYDQNEVEEQQLRDLKELRDQRDPLHDPLGGGKIDISGRSHFMAPATVSGDSGDS